MANPEHYQSRYSGPQIDEAIRQVIEGEVSGNGGYYTPDVSESGVLSWEPSASTMPDVPEFDIVGAVLAALPTWEGGSY